MNDILEDCLYSQEECDTSSSYEYFGRCWLTIDFRFCLSVGRSWNQQLTLESKLMLESTIDYHSRVLELAYYFGIVTEDKKEVLEAVSTVFDFRRLQWSLIIIVGVPPFMVVFAWKVPQSYLNEIYMPGENASTINYCPVPVFKRIMFMYWERTHFAFKMARSC
jgi:hypothetical protein